MVNENESTEPGTRILFQGIIGVELKKIDIMSGMNKRNIFEMENKKIHASTLLKGV